MTSTPATTIGRECWVCGAERPGKTRKGRCESCERTRAAEYARDYYPRWKAKNLDRWLEYQRAYGRQHMDRKIENATRWQSEHRALQNERIADWKRRHPEKVTEYQHRRRARKMGAAYEVIDRRVVFERDGYVCHICSEVVDSSNLSLDHVVPLAKGGAHTYENVSTAHVLCNVRKGSRLLEDDWP